MGFLSHWTARSGLPGSKTPRKAKADPAGGGNRARALPTHRWPASRSASPPIASWGCAARFACDSPAWILGRGAGASGLRFVPLRGLWDASGRLWGDIHGGVDRIGELDRHAPHAAQGLPQMRKERVGSLILRTVPAAVR